MMLNPDLRDTATPPIPEAKAWARDYDGAAGPLVDLSQAVPGDPPPPELLDRLRDAAGRPETATYGPIAGHPQLREAYAAQADALYGGEIRPDEVAITAGCNQAFFIAMLALARAGDAVMLPTPWYFNHKMALDMLGIRTVCLPCRAEDGFVPDAEAAEELIEPGLKAIVLVTPNNPTGAVYPPATIKRFAALCRRRGLTLVLDETYRDFIAGRPHELFADPAWRDTVIGLYSFSKSYAIPGHRLGALTAASSLMPELFKVIDTLQICAPQPAQAPIAWAIEALAAWREHNRQEIMDRATLFTAALQGLNGWHISSIGAYFAFLRHPRLAEGAGVARDLVEQRGVLSLPGAYFGPGQETHVRTAFANVGRDKLALLRDRFAGFA